MFPVVKFCLSFCGTLELTSKKPWFSFIFFIHIFWLANSNIWFFRMKLNNQLFFFLWFVNQLLADVMKKCSIEFIFALQNLKPKWRFERLKYQDKRKSITKSKTMWNSTISKLKRKMNFMDASSVPILYHTPWMSGRSRKKERKSFIESVLKVSACWKNYFGWVVGWLLEFH